MLRAVETLTGQGPVLLIGTDGVALDAGHLRLAARLLSLTDAVAVPVEDGGYILLGLHQAMPSLFSDVEWGTSVVMSETRRRAEAAGIDLVELEPLWDIDRPEDFVRARAQGML
jgi:glycosyltransferase A (GT-A) superfamily protein (DUF2064 family)